MAIKTSGIDHIHFNVRHMKRFLEIMGGLFDIDATKVGHLQPLDLYNSVVHLAGADAGQPFLDIFQPASETSPVARVINKRGEGVSFISFRVENIEAAAEHAAKCGLREISRIGFQGEKQVQFDTIDTLGFMLEFVEYEPDFDAQLVELKRRLTAGETVDGLRYVEL